MIRLPPKPTLFPYTTLFRSADVPHPAARDPARLALRQGEDLAADARPRPRDRSDPRPHRASEGATRRASDRKSTRLNSSHSQISYAVFCLKKKINEQVLKIV